MKLKLHVTLLLVGSIFLTGCLKEDFPNLKAKQFIAGTYINIYSPNAYGWAKLKSSASGVIFGKKGKHYNESYIARVVFFPIESSKTKNAFLQSIKNAATKDTDKMRFTKIKSSFALSNKRTYTCVLVKERVKDKSAMTQDGVKTTLTLQVKSLYCKDPQRKNIAFVIAYSYRGQKLNKSFDSEADSFIDAVRFPKHN